MNLDRKTGPQPWGWQAMARHAMAADEKMERADGMRNRVERLRLWLLASAGFLLVVILAFVGSAHFLAHRRLALPARLGVNIVRETNGFNYYQAMQGKTVFAIHAANAVEHTDGKITLHDVSIMLYGEKQDRNDRISGDEFEYDQKAGVVRAAGVVHMDLQAAQPGAGKAASGASAAKVMHVTTSGLVYLKDLGVAATNEYIEFQSGAMTGHATGASYSSDSSLLMLHSAVSMSGMAGKRAVTVTAATADLDNRNQEAFLSQARYVSQGQTVEAERATLHTRPDGTLARVEAQGNVTANANGATVVSQRADVVLNAKSQPESAVLTGGVQYTSNQPLQQRSGQADAAKIGFDAKAQAKHAEFMGAVRMSERTRATEAAMEPWSTRELTAAKVEAELGSEGGNTRLRDVEATGNPHLTAINNGTLASKRGMGRTELSADELKAHLVDAKDARQPTRLDTVAGRGHTLLRQVGPDGTEQTSAGDTLDAKFRPEGPAHSGSGSAKSGEGLDDLLSAVQQGHVSIMRRAPAKRSALGGGATVRQRNAQEDVEHVSAQRAAYDGDPDRVTLTGGVQMSDAESVLWAQQVVLDRATGDAHAAGAVKVNYVQQASAPGGGAANEPAHLLAERADLVHASEVATFYGRPARLWQGGSQVQAPVIELARAQQRLTARGEASAGGMQVHTVLMGAESGNSSVAKAGAPQTGTGTPGCANRSTAKTGAGNSGEGAAGADAPTSVVRIASGGLVYSGMLRQAEFSGGVRAETVDGTIRANEATVHLQQAQAGGGAAAGAADALPSFAGEVESVVAAGKVELDQPGTRATGERLVYTASEQTALLTGDGKTPPRAVGAQGTTTGTALRFNFCDDSIEVLGAPGQPARTDARPGDDGGNGKGTR